MASAPKARQQHDRLPHRDHRVRVPRGPRPRGGLGLPPGLSSPQKEAGVSFQAQARYRGQSWALALFLGFFKSRNYLFL